MPRPSQYLGTGAVVECAVRLVNPVEPWKGALPNAYETTRERFTVKGVDRTTPDSLVGAKVELTHTKFPGKTFTAAAVVRRCGRAVHGGDWDGCAGGATQECVRGDGGCRRPDTG